MLRMAGCTPRSGKLPAQRWALQLPPPGGDSSVPPKLGGVGGCQSWLLSWDEQRFSLDLLAWEETCRCCHFCSSTARRVLRSGGTPKCFAVPLSVPHDTLGTTSLGETGSCSPLVWHHTLQMSLSTPPPTSPGCSCAKKQSNQPKKSTEGPQRCPQPPPPTGPKVSAEHLFPRSVLAHPTPPHPGARRSQKTSSPSPSRPQNTPQQGEAPLSQGVARTHFEFPSVLFPRCQVHPQHPPAPFHLPGGPVPRGGARRGPSWAVGGPSWAVGGAQKPALSELLRLL